MSKRSRGEYERRYQAALNLAHRGATSGEREAARLAAQRIYNTHLLPTLVTPIPRGAKGFGKQGWGRWIGGARRDDKKR